MLLQRFGLTWNILLLAVAGAVGIAVGLNLIRRLLGRILGPIFEYETVRLARKGRLFWLRIGFAVLTLALLYAAVPDWSAAPSYELVAEALTAGTQNLPQVDNVGAHVKQLRLSRFAPEFTDFYLLALAACTLLATPLFLAGAITELKEKRTLELMFATGLTGSDIVGGKLWARLLSLFDTLLVALPILAATQLWGGVDWRLIAYACTLIFVAMTSCACVSIACSVICERTRTAVLAAYALTLLPELALLLLDAPFSTIQMVRYAGAMIAPSSDPHLAGRHDFESLLMFVSGHLVVSFFAGASATRWLRPLFLSRLGRPTRVAAPESGAGIPHPAAIGAKPAITGDPFIWKERYAGRRAWIPVGSVRLTTAITFIVFAVPLLVRETFYPWTAPAPEMERDARVLLVVVCSFVLVTFSLRLAASVSREREQQTMTSLLTLPVPWPRILYGKWAGAWLRTEPWLLVVALVFLLTCMLGGVHPAAWLVFPLAFVGHLWFFGNLGLLFSVISRSANRACFALLAVLLMVVVGNWLIGRWSYSLFDTSGDPAITAPSELGWIAVVFPLTDHWEADMDDCLIPPQTWWHLTANRDRLRQTIRNVPNRYGGEPPRQEPVGFGWIPHLLVILGYYILGWQLWLLAGRIFRREGLRA